MPFSKEVKRNAKREAGYCCEYCGRKPSNKHHDVLEAHHILPASMGGSSHRENLVYLDNLCHTYWNFLAIRGGIFYGYKTVEELNPKQFEYYPQTKPPKDNNEKFYYLEL